MTISAFVREDHSGTSWASSSTPKRRLYREAKRLEAQERQAAFDAEVARTAGEQNCLLEVARDVVRSRRRFEHRTGRLTPISLDRIR